MRARALNSRPAGHNWLRLGLRAIVTFVCMAGIAIGIARWSVVQRFYAIHAPVWAARRTVAPKSASAALIVAGARAQIGTVYDADYVQIPYPNGDVASDRGACADVVVRAFRKAGFDLQQLVHDDMTADLKAYPQLDGLTRPDSNIDHRRVLIQMCYFARHGLTVTSEVSPGTLADWQPGDVVYWKTPGNRQHAGVLSDSATADGVPLVIHNGSVCIEQNCLTRWKIIGHFRYPKRAVGSQCRNVCGFSRLGRQRSRSISCKSLMTRSATALYFVRNLHERMSTLSGLGRGF